MNGKSASRRRAILSTSNVKPSTETSGAPGKPAASTRGSGAAGASARSAACTTVTTGDDDSEPLDEVVARGRAKSASSARWIAIDNAYGARCRIGSTVVDLTFCQTRVKPRAVVPLLTGQHELIAIGILEDCERAPGLLRRCFHELDAPPGQLLPRLLDVVARQRPI